MTNKENTFEQRIMLNMDYHSIQLNQIDLNSCNFCNPKKYPNWKTIYYNCIKMNYEGHIIPDHPVWRSKHNHGETIVPVGAKIKKSFSTRWEANLFKIWTYFPQDIKFPEFIKRWLFNNFMKNYQKE